MRRSVAVGLLRGGGRARAGEGGVRRGAVAPRPGAGGELEAIAARTVVALVKALPPDQAEIIMLRVVAGLEAGEVARIVGKTPGAVRVTAHRALRRLAGLAERAGVTK